MSYPPKHLVPLSPINLLLMKARAARTQATRSRAIVAQLAALPVSNRASVSAAREHEEAAADNAPPCAPGCGVGYGHGPGSERT
jgi:hypothetical protein